MSEHTPGPWGYRFEADSGNFIVGIPDPEQADEDIYDSFLEGGFTSLDVATEEANARLIAAAPDLLEALRTIVFQVAQGKVLERDACIARARAAIAKATGEHT